MVPYQKLNQFLIKLDILKKIVKRQDTHTKKKSQ